MDAHRTIVRWIHNNFALLYECENARESCSYANKVRHKRMKFQRLLSFVHSFLDSCAASERNMISIKITITPRFLFLTFEHFFNTLLRVV